MKNWLLRKTIFDSLGFSFLFAIILYVLLRPGEEHFLQLKENFIIFLILFIVSFLLSLLINYFNIPTWGDKIFISRIVKVDEKQSYLQKNFWKWQSLIIMAALFIIGLRVTDFSLRNIFDKDGFAGAVRIFSELLQPNFEILPRAILRMFETVFMAFLATVFAIPIAFVLSFAAAKNIMKHPLAYAAYLLLRTILNVVRSIEAFMWAIIFSVWVGIGPAAGFLALMVHSVASLAKQFSEIVEGINDGPVEAIQSCGANQLQTIWFAIVPQVLLPFISFAVYRWDINVRMATIVGFVGGGGIGKLLIAYQGQAQWKEVGCLFLVIAVVVWILDLSSAYLREALK